MRSRENRRGRVYGKLDCIAGGRSIIWHAMKHYATYGYNEFIICTGYRSDLIKDYFLNYYIYQSDVTVDFSTNEVEIHNKKTEDWKVSVIDMGMYPSISDRILKIIKNLWGGGSPHLWYRMLQESASLKYIWKTPLPHHILPPIA